MQVSWVLLLFTALVALAMLVQAGVMVGMFIAARVSLKRMEGLAKMAEEHALPALISAKSLLDAVSPKLKIAADNVAAVSEMLRTQTQSMNQTLDDVLKKTEVQAARVDEMITGTLNAVADATAAAQRAVTTPVRQVNALLNGLRVGMDVLRGRSREAHAAADGDHFV